MVETVESKEKIMKISYDTFKALLLTDTFPTDRVLYSRFEAHVREGGGYIDITNDVRMFHWIFPWIFITKEK